jgi:hypothetical protein
MTTHTEIATEQPASTPPADPPTQAEPRGPDDPRFHALDFWIGTWIARVPDGRAAGRNEIVPILDGAVLSENWTGARGYTGKSYSFYDRSLDTWRQVWRDNQGDGTDFTHGVAGDGVVTFFTGGEAIAPGTRRLTFTRIDSDHVRQLSEVAGDDGSWSTEYDLAYERVAGAEEAQR